MTDLPNRNSDARPRLGRGLAALLGEPKTLDTPPASTAHVVKRVAIEFVRSNPRNPRQTFLDDELEELASSIKERGIIQPIVVRPIPGVDDAYEIIAGERRWRAAQRAGEHTVPIVSVAVSDREALELSIIENVQRADLTALEEAKGYAQLAAEYGYSHADVGRIVGKSRSHVANTLRLLALPEHTRELLATGAISAGHARALLALDNPDAIADRVVTRGLTVRDLEKMTDGDTSSSVTGAEGKVVDIDPATRDLENRISLSLGAKAEIKNSKRFRELRIHFRDFEQLDFICNKLLQE